MPWPGNFPHTDRRTANAMSSSPPPLRRTDRTETSSSEKRQLRTAPSAVRRSLLQVPQKGRVTLATTPISPAPSQNR